MSKTNVMRQDRAVLQKNTNLVYKETFFEEENFSVIKVFGILGQALLKSLSLIVAVD